MQVTRQRPQLGEDVEYEAEYLPWGDFLGDAFPWEQGEHVTIAAPTGWGKTTLELGLARAGIREYQLLLATKPRDATLDSLIRDGWRVVRELPLPPTVLHQRVIFWPRIDTASRTSAQRDAFREVLLQVYEVGGWTVYVDELDYICNFLKLSPLVELLWRQGRSLGVTVVGGTQRPAFVPLLAYDQATHLFVGRDNDDVNLRRYASISGGGKEYQRDVKRAIRSLDAHEFLYLSARREGFVTTKVAA